MPNLESEDKSVPQHAPRRHSTGFTNNTNQQEIVSGEKSRASSLSL